MPIFVSFFKRRKFNTLITAGNRLAVVGVTIQAACSGRQRIDLSFGRAGRPVPNIIQRLPAQF